MNKHFNLDCIQLQQVLQTRLNESAPSRIQLLSGPRQVGKTTIMLKLAKHFGEQAIYASMDAPEALTVGFWERLWTQAERMAQAHGKAVLFLDEIQHLSNWSARLKSDWDRIVHLQLPIHVVASGSSSLQLSAGSQESLAGRFEKLTLPHWSPKSLSEVFAFSPEEAVDYFVSYGSYPGAVGLRHDPARWLAYLRDSIIEPAIGRDILALEAIRKPALIRQIFSIAATIPSQVFSLQKFQGQLQDKGALATISHYLELLEHAFLIGSAHKFTHQPFRKRESPPKIIVLNQGICAAMDPRGVPQKESDPARFGAWVENACQAFLWNQGKQVSYWREEPYEVDIVLDDGADSWAIEVKTDPYTENDLRGLLEFTKRYPRFRPLVLCDENDLHVAKRLGLASIPWRHFLIEGLPS